MRLNIVCVLYIICGAIVINFHFQACLFTRRDDEKQLFDMEDSKSKVEHGCQLVVSQSIMERAKYHAQNFRLQDIYNEMVLLDDLMLYRLKENVPSPEMFTLNLAWRASASFQSELHHQLQF